MASKKTIPVRADVALSFWTNKDRKEFAAALGKVAPASAVYGTSATLQTSIANVVKCGVDLAATDDAVALKRKEVVAAEAARNAASIVYDKELAVCTKVAEGVCSTVEELEVLGFKARGARRPSVALVAPMVISAISGKEKGWVFARVKRIPGITKYIAELNLDPTSSEWKPLPGTGAIRRFGGLGSGTRCWIRFATARGIEQSGWSEEVTMVAR